MLASFQTAIREPVVVVSPRRIVEQHIEAMPVARVLYGMAVVGSVSAALARTTSRSQSLVAVTCSDPQTFMWPDTASLAMSARW